MTTIGHIHITTMHILHTKRWYGSIGNGGVSTPKPLWPLPVEIEGVPVEIIPIKTFNTNRAYKLNHIYISFQSYHPVWQSTSPISAGTNAVDLASSNTTDAAVLSRDTSRAERAVRRGDSLCQIADSKQCNAIQQEYQTWSGKAKHSTEHPNANTNFIFFSIHVSLCHIRNANS